MPTVKGAYARNQNRLRQRHPDVVQFRLNEAARYETYERSVLARNWNASASPRYLEHFQHGPHKSHMVSSCIEEVTRAVANIQVQQQQQQKNEGTFTSRDNTRGTSTTKTLFMSEDAQRGIMNRLPPVVAPTTTAAAAASGDDAMLSAADLVSGGKKIARNSAAAAAVSSSSASQSSPASSPSKQQQDKSSAGDGGFFQQFQSMDPTKKFKFKPVQLAEAMADVPVHPLPRPPLFSRPSNAQTVVVGGDIRMVGRASTISADGSLSIDAAAAGAGGGVSGGHYHKHSASAAAAAAAVAKDPKMLAVRIAVEQNPLHEAIEQMRQVTAAMAVKTYNAVNGMAHVMRLTEKREAEFAAAQAMMDAAPGRANFHTNYSSHYQQLQQQQYANGSSRRRSPSPPNATPSTTTTTTTTSGRTVGGNSGITGRRPMRTATFLSTAVKSQAGRIVPPAQVAVVSSARQASVRRHNIHEKNQQPQKTVLPGRHLEDSALDGNRPPTREARSASGSPRRSNNVRIAPAPPDVAARVGAVTSKLGAAGGAFIASPSSGKSVSPDNKKPGSASSTATAVEAKRPSRPSTAERKSGRQANGGASIEKTAKKAPTTAPSTTASGADSSSAPQQPLASGTAAVTDNNDNNSQQQHDRQCEAQPAENDEPQEQHDDAGADDADADADDAAASGGSGSEVPQRDDVFDEEGGQVIQDA